MAAELCLWHPSSGPGRPVAPRPPCWTLLAFRLASHSGWALWALHSFGSIPGPARLGRSVHAPTPAVRTSVVSRLCRGPWHEAPFSPTDLLLQGLWPPPASCRPPAPSALRPAPPLPSAPLPPAPGGRSGGAPALPPGEAPPPLTHFILIHVEA